MQRAIDVADVERRLRSILNDVARNHVSYVLTNENQPEAVLISYEEFSRLRDLDERGVFADLDRLLSRMAEENAQYTDEEISADVEAAREEAAR
jgi:prevent-host-death family protein